MIKWNKDKYIKLKKERRIDLYEIEQMILNKKYITILKNPSRPKQKMFILKYRNYIHCVPFLIDRDKDIILKTVYARRKFNRIYGGRKN